MRIHYLQHVPFEGLGSIEPWLTKHGYTLTVTRFFEDRKLPALEEIDGLIIMGGPMGVNDEGKFPWLAQEKAFIRSAIKAGKPVLGICLGAQLIAAALGARVYKNSLKEIGWFPVKGIRQNKEGLFSFPENFTAFHWHGDTFDLPVGANLLATNTTCRNQAFQVGQRVMGLQFHLETTPQSLRLLIDNARQELQPAKFIQSEEQMLPATPQMFAEINRLMGQVLDYLFG